MKLLHGDCLDLMKEIDDESIDMILTDPPYGMEFRSNHRKIRHDSIKNDSNVDWLPYFAQECFRVAKNNTAHYVFCSFHKIDLFKQAFDKHFVVKNVLVWEKNNTSMGDLEHDFATKLEFILFIQKGKRKINGARDPNIFKYPKTKNELHPTEKPVGLCEYMLSKFSDPGDLVIDPFMGSGTTGVACVNLKREFIGIELDEKHFKTAEKRINTAATSLKQVGLFGG